MTEEIQIPEDFWVALPVEIQQELTGIKRKCSDGKYTDYVPPLKLKQTRLNLFQGTHSKLPLLNEMFTDHEFPADASSIDGRKSSDQVEAPQIKCNCGFTAKLKKVYKDGPNQGRFFQSCQQRKCDFFLWSDSAPHSKESLKKWLRFGIAEGYKMVILQGFHPSSILQGQVGDCWFLSAVAVISERRDLIERIVKCKSLSNCGKHLFSFFFDGEWRDVVVDNYLPVRIETNKKVSSETFMLAFSRASQSQLWVPLLEKAYAKLHGSYQAISGGYIHEALLDLTGAPCEVIDFSSIHFESECTWLRLLSFNAARFPMGASTVSSGEGILLFH